MPVIYFAFSRKNCEKYGRELTQIRDFASKKQKAEIIQIVNGHANREVKQMQSYAKLRRCLINGVAYHHAGLLPNLKEIVERLFEKGLISVLYATETFAVGINMPAKTVCFDSLEKFDGMSFRYLNSKEYFQIAGRAGRRGIDTHGFVISLVDRVRTDIQKVKKITTKDVEPIISQFRLSVNTVLNLVRNHNDEEIDTILKSNFDYFLRSRSDKQVRVLASYNNKIRKLITMGYVTEEKNLTAKGDFATHIYFEELLFTEIFFSNMYEKLTEAQINCVIAAIVYEERRADRFRTKGAKESYGRMLKVLSQNRYVVKNINQRSLFRLTAMISSWSGNCEFIDLLDYANLLEGDIIRLFRRMIDAMRQIIKATDNYALKEKMVNCIKKIDRDIVKAEFE